MLQSFPENCAHSQKDSLLVPKQTLLRCGRARPGDFIADHLINQLLLVLLPFPNPLPSSFNKWDVLHSTHVQKYSGFFSDSGESLTLLSPAGGLKPICEPQAASSSLQPLLSHILGSANIYMSGL